MIASYSHAALPNTMSDNDPQLCQMDLSVILLKKYLGVILLFSGFRKVEL